MKNFWLEKHIFFKKNDYGILNKFIDEYSSPSFLYSKEVISNRYNNLISSLPAKVKVFYAQKSNPHTEILKHIKSLGAGCDTASEGEVKNAFEAGFTAHKIMMTGPAKTDTEIRNAIEKNLLSINAESLQEIIMIDRICSEYGKRQDVLIRINPEFEAGEANRIIGGMGVSKFGIDIDQIPEVLNTAKKLSNININGIHIFNSSQILDWKRIFGSAKGVLDTAIRLSSEYNLDFELIDAGGGFGIPYSENEDNLDTEKLGEALGNLFESPDYKSFINNVNVVFEPGRYLTGECGIYITKVLYIKKSAGKNIALIDGGIHHLLRPALIGHKHPVINLSAISEGREKTGEYVIAGPLCTSLDEFDNSAVLNEVIPGDKLVVLNAGAYGFTESMPLFLSHKPAKEIFID